MSRKSRKSSTNPFGALKGFRVSKADKKPSRPTQAEEAKPETDLFAREMERLGLERQGGSASPPPRPLSSPPPEAEDEQDLFLAALGKLDVTFSENFAEVEEERAAEPRRMKLLRQGKLVPEAVLDLHGLDRVRARERVGHFLENAVWHGRRTVLIITGRGHGSGGEPVLRQEIEKFLAEQSSATVSEWGRAPARYGGEGALIVFLRK